MSRSFFAVGSFALLLLAAVSPGESAGPLEDPFGRAIRKSRIHIALDEVASGFQAPNWAVPAPGDATRLFVGDQVGLLHAVKLSDGSKTTFLDVSSLLVPLGIGGPGTYDERGFLAFAFHPSYAMNGLLYTYTSEPVDGAADFSTMPPCCSTQPETVSKNSFTRLRTTSGSVPVTRPVESTRSTNSTVASLRSIPEV
jgi:hypothetical protein